ncbi:MAG: proton-conducting transporter membrane subunit [Kiritimatiellales bacterium]|jgi:hydrogenase-4 component B
MQSHLSILLLLVSAALHTLSGIPGLLMSRRTAASERVTTIFSCTATAIGLAGVALVFLRGTDSAVLPWSVMGEPMKVAADGLSAFFIVPVLVMGALGSVYGLGYWPQSKHADNGHSLRLFWGLAIAGMTLLLLARHAVLFLMGWEIMALPAFFLVSTEHRQPEVRRAGWIYLVATHIGTLSLFALFALFHWITGSFEMRALAASEAGLGTLTVIFFLALVGFGVKAGMMPFHFWLPAAHANAPSHISALLSGVMLKIGIYGLIRFVGFLPDPPVSWGAIILASGCISGVLGVVFAIGQHDLKRLLAYHSIENIGIILMGFGLAMIGRSLGHPLWVILGMAGCLLHVWNHGLFKTLLFLSAGSAIHSSETRQIDQMGGLAKSLPWTAAFFLIGAVAICGLPPLNGFVSEWFVYLGLFHAATADTSMGWTAAALAAPVLAIIGALALACFVKVYGAVFLGQPRQPLESVPHEAPLSMQIPMGVLAGCCALIGLFPWLVAPVLSQTILSCDIAGLLQSSCPLSALTPLPAITLTSLALIGACLILYFRLSRRIQWSKAPHTITWSCGYARPTVRMQYTASSFAQMLTTLFRSVLSPRIHEPEIRSVFAEPSRYETHQDEPVLDRKLIPAAHFMKQLFSRARPLQRGLTHQYLIYVALTVIILLIWTLPILTIFKRLFTR